MSESKATELADIKRKLENANILINILSIVAQDSPLENILDQAMDELLSASWLSFMPIGGVFVADETEKKLRLVAKKNLSPELHTLCAKVPYGHCLCGRTAANRKVEFAKCIDDRHDITFDGMEPHGHYNIPILHGQELLGVMIVYLPHGHKKNKIEIEFLSSVAKALSMLLHVKNKEMALKSSQHQLESYLHQLDSQNMALQKQAEEMVVLSEEQYELRTKAEILQEKALYASRHDSLTDLPNRAYFTSRCKDAVIKAQKTGKISAFLFIDIDGFKCVNDTMGHNSGDELLIQISKRLKNSVRDEDIVARFGGDEFIIFLKNLPSIDHGKSIADKIVRKL